MKSRSKIVLIANPSADVYGSDLQMLESVSALRAAGYHVVVAIPEDGPLVAKLRERGADVEFVRFPVVRRANQSIRSFVRLGASAAAAVPRIVRVIRRVAPAVIYVNTVTLPWWLLAARLTRTPAVCHLHEAENTDGGFVRRALMAPLRMAAAVIVISKATMTAMVEVDPKLASRGRLIYNGVPQPPQFPQAARRQEPMHLIVVGRLSPRKAPHLALEAVGQLRTQGYRVEIELAGTAFPGYDWYVEQLKQRAEQPDLMGAVSFAGYCSPIWPNLNQADIVVAPSLREPFGNAVVEAQMSRRPVVATAALGHLESIEDGQTGLLVPAEDVEAMAAAIARFVDDPDLAERVAIQARESAVTRFSTARYSDEVVALVDQLAAQLRS